MPKNATSFKPGNELWKLAQFPGKPRKYPTAESLWDACVKYFEWADKTPVKQHRHEYVNGKLRRNNAYSKRPFTKAGLYIALNIDRQTWANYKDHGADYLAVIDRVESIMFEQKFSGASAGHFKTNIIARDLGLAEKKELSGPEGSPIPVSNEWVVTPIATPPKPEE